MLLALALLKQRPLSLIDISFTCLNLSFFVRGLIPSRFGDIFYSEIDFEIVPCNCNYKFILFCIFFISSCFYFNSVSLSGDHSL